MCSRLLTRLALACLAVSPALAGGGKITWTDATAGLAEARRSGKPVFMYFTADW